MKRVTKKRIKTTRIYFRSQRKSRILMLNINENCRNRRRKRSTLKLIDRKLCHQHSINILLWRDNPKLRLPQMLSIILPFVFLLTLKTTQITSVDAQKVSSLAHHQALMSSNDDEELSKTMNGIGDEELSLNHPTTATTPSSAAGTTSSSTLSTVQPQLSPSISPTKLDKNNNDNENESQQHQQRNGHSIKSIWTPPDGNHDESLGSSADLMRQPEGDEEFAGHAEPSELNRQYISVLNNQSDIVFNNNTKHDSGNELQHATTFLLGKASPSLTATATTSALSNGPHNNNNNNDFINYNNYSNENEQNNYNETRASPSSGNEITLLGARFNEGLFTSPSSVRMVQFESQSNVTGNGSNRVASLATSTQPASQIEQTTAATTNSLGASRSSETSNFTPTAITATKQKAYDSKLVASKKRKKERPTIIKGYTKQNDRSNKNLNNGNNNNYLNLTNASSGDVGAKMISYSLVPTSTTTNRPKFGSFVLLNKQDLEGQMLLAATSSPIRSIVMPNKQLYHSQLQQQQQISPLPTKASNRNVALIIPSGANFGGASSVGNQIKLLTASSPPDGRYLAAAAAAASTDQFGSSSPPVISSSSSNNNNSSSKESIIFDPSNNLSQKQSTTSSESSGTRNMPDGAPNSSSSPNSGSSSLSHLFPSPSSFASSSASTLSTAAATASTKSTSYPVSIIDPSTRASLFEQFRRSPLLNKALPSSFGGGDHTKQSLSLNDFLLTSSSSHQPNEFETTLKQQPDHQHDPIVQLQDGSNSIPITLEANSSEISPVSPSHKYQQQQQNASLLYADMSDDDEEPDNETNDSFEVTHGGDFEPKNEAVNGQDQDKKPTRLDIKSNQLQQQQQQQQQQLATNEQQTHQQHQKPINPDTELLVGPFKSESEAPATITLSGVVYQKSGASSSFLRQTSKPEVNDKENLSTSGSQQASASTTNNNISNSVMQLKPDSSYKVFDSSQLKGLKLEDLVNQSDKIWPYSSSGSGHWPLTSGLGGLNSNGNQHQLGSINEILLGSIKSAGEPSLSMDTIKDSTSGGSSLFSSLQLPDSYMGLSGGIRLGPFPFSPASLLSNSLFGSASHHLLDDLTAQKLTKSGSIEQQASTLSTDHAPLWGSTTTSSSSSSPMASASSASGISTTGKANKLTADSYYLGSLNAAPSDNHYHSKQKDKGPIVIVQKDVKPVKYHLMRAYLKLRRLLRPFEATYVFLNDRHSLVKRRQTAHRQMALKAPRGEGGSNVSSLIQAKQPGMLETLATATATSKTKTKSKTKAKT